MAVKSWSIEKVESFLNGLELSSIVPAFKANAVDGQDLIQLTDEDMATDLGMTPLQIAKVKKGLQKLSQDSTSAVITGGVATGVVMEADTPQVEAVKYNAISDVQYAQVEEGNPTVIHMMPAPDPARARKKKIIIGLLVGLVSFRTHFWYLGWEA